MTSFLIYGGGILVVLFLVLTVFGRARVVVPTNAVHIVQTSKKRTSYGQQSPSGNVYYRWPSWIPVIGVQVSVLPTSVFQLSLKNYAAYDVGRVPFQLDILAFFRINDSNIAAERVTNFEGLKSQLEGILQGASRTIFASAEIQEILEGRSTFGDRFTHAVTDQLKQWGVEPVKNIEFMDIRDDADSKVIANIMAKKKSQIEMESRVTVAGNQQKAQTAEIEAIQNVKVRQQEQEEAIGVRTAEKEQAIGIRTQKATQAVRDEEKVTAAKTVEVQTVAEVGKANIARSVRQVEAERDKQVQITNAEASRQVAITNAEGTKQQAVLVAEGNLSQALNAAEGIAAKGKAEGEAATAMQMAPVNAQLALADKIAKEEGYQRYLVTIKQIEAGRDAAIAVGVEQAKALEKADVKIFSTAGNSPVDGVGSVMDLFGPKGGMRLGSFLEALKATGAGAEVVDRVTNGNGTVAH